MELNKLIRRKQKAEDENNQAMIAEMCNKLGCHYMNDSKYQEALIEFRQESIVYQTLDKKMDFGRANRMIGEVYMLMEKYSEALKHEDIYMKIANQENNLVELQRAYTTVGRCYLLQAEDNENKDSKSGFKAAEKSFLKGLIICKDLSKEVSKWELADMQARLYLNLGITKEHMQEFDEAISCYETCNKICKSNDLFELRHKSLMALGLAHVLNKSETSTALNHFNMALEVAKRLQDKSETMSETLLAKSQLLVQNGDYQSAKQVLKKAYKLNTPNVADKEVIQKHLKIVIALCKYEDELVTTDSYNYSKRKELFEKLGDGSCKLKNYSKAIDSYLKCLEASQLNGDGEQQFIPIYVSLYQTYIDNKEFQSALEFMNKEYELIKHEPKEACLTLLSLGNLLDLAGKDFWEVDAAYRKGLLLAKEVNDVITEKALMKKLVSFSRKRHMISLAEILEQEATERNIDLIESSEEIDYSEDIVDCCDDINLDIQLSSDADSSNDEQNHQPKETGTSSRKKRSAFTVKKNAKGETRLHEACIRGNYQVAKMLIDQGHSLNVRDNAGWLPLHEAAIYGYRDLVELLLDSGAQSSINDKGGTSCDGITPLYDAASNGNLSVVQLLLDRGAKATVRTDFNETPLDALLRWFNEYGHKLTPAEKGFYDEIKQKLTECCEKVGIDTTTKAANTSSSGYNSGRTRNSQTSQQEQSLRFNTSFSEESADEEKPASQLDTDNIKKKARLDYKTAMSGLKNSHKEQRFISDDHCGINKRTAHLTVQEVDLDEWLEDDIGPSRKKQKFYSENPSGKAPTPVKSLARNASTVLLNSDSDVEINNENLFREDSSDAFDVLMNAGNSAGKKKPKKTNAVKPLRRTSVQPSLLDSGFSRFIDIEEPSRLPLQQHPSNNSSLNDSFNQSNPLERQLIIKVQIDDEKIIVPVNKDASSELKISWLVEEAARRYYCIKGIRPELKLKTSDGATLLQTDPVSLIMSLTEENLIQSEILDWNLPSLSKRYLEACSELKCAVDHDLNELLDVNRSAICLDLSNQNLCSMTVRPVLKALQHQSCLLQLNLSDNFIQNEGIKFLTQTLVTLKQLQSLSVCGNLVTETGVELLCNNLTKSQFPSEIKQMKLSYNPIKSSSLKHVSILCQIKSVESLSLASCELTDAIRLDQLATVKSLDLSYNHLTGDGFRQFLRKLNPGIIENLNLERCSVAAGLGESIVQFISSGCCASLKEINLAGMNFTENEVLDILRSLEKCEQLKHLDFSYQRQLTFLSVKYILLNMESRCLERVKLIGCQSLQSPLSLFNLQNIDETRRSYLKNVQFTLPRSDAKTEFVDKMKEMWNIVSGFRGRINHDKNVLHLLNDYAKE